MAHPDVAGRLFFSCWCEQQQQNLGDHGMTELEELGIWQGAKSDCYPDLLARFAPEPHMAERENQLQKVVFCLHPIPWHVQHAHTREGIPRDSEEDWDLAGNPDSPSMFGIRFVSYSTNSR